MIDKASLIQIPSGYKNGKLYSLKPSNGDGDFDFSRSSSGTRVNSEGLIETAQIVSTTELVTNGDFATDSDWTKGSGWTISGGTASQDNSTPNSGDLTQSNVTTSGKIYKVTFDLVVTSGTISALVGGHNLFTSSGTKTFIKTATSSNLTFRNYSNFIGSIDNVSVKEVIENDVPRLDYSDGSCASLLLEGQSTNLITYSEDFSQSYWSKSSITVTDGFTSPSGDLTASKFTEGSTNINHQIYRAIAGTAGNTYTLSGFFKKGERDIVQLLFGGASFDEGSVYCNFDLENGVLGSGTYLDASITLISNGWYRCSLTATKTTTGNFNSTYCPKLTATSSRAAAYLGDGTSGIYAYGAQVEQGSYPTSYIPSNSGSSTTRTADVCNNAGTSATFNSTEGVLFAEMVFSDDNQYKFISLNSGSSANRVSLYSNSPTFISVNVRNPSGNQFNANLSIDSTINHKIALKYKENDFALWVDGQERLTDSSGTTFTTSTLSELSFDDGGGGADFYGKCKQLIVFNEALSDSELQTLTTL